MKKIFVLLSFLLRHSAGQPKIILQDTIATPTITAIGEADGEKNSIIIDKEGVGLYSCRQKNGIGIS